MDLNKIQTVYIQSEYIDSEPRTSLCCNVAAALLLSCCYAELVINAPK